MFATHQPTHNIRRAEPDEASLIRHLRLSSLVCLEMHGHALTAIGALVDALPDADPALVAEGRYFVADAGGDLLGGAGWSVLPLQSCGDRIVDEGGEAANLTLSVNAVLVRGFFLDPDLGRRGTGARLLGEIEADAARAGYEAAEIIAPATSDVMYRSLGFKPVRKLGLRLSEGVLPLIQMRKWLAASLAIAA